MQTATVSLLLIILTLAPTYKARPQNVNISQSGNVRITTIDGVIKCDEMVCPSNSIGCSVTMDTTKDFMNIETVRKCYDSNRVTTKEERSTEPNPNLGTAVSSHMDSSSSGVIQQFNYGNGGALASKIDAITKQFQEWQQKFQHEMTAFNTNLNNQILQSFQYSS